MDTWDYLGYHQIGDSNEIYGCMDILACNYNSEATIDNGSCTYESELFDCDGNCLTYIDECDVCGGDGTSCVGANVFISEYSEGSSYNKYIEIYNGTGQDLDLSSYELWKIANGGAWSEYTLALSATVLVNDVYVVCAATADNLILAECDETWSSANFNGDDAMGLAFNNELIDQVGESGADVGDGWEVAGVTNATQNHTLVRNSNILVGNTNWSLSAGTNAADSEWTVFDQNTWDYIGSHPHDFGNISGCTDPDAANYNPNAGTDDGSCEYAQIVTIQDIQGTGDASPILGQIVQTSGIVTGVSYSGFFIQDGSGPWSGLWIYISSFSVQVGDYVQVSGEVAEYNGLTEIAASNVSVLSSENELPEATLISTGDLSEEYESVRVQLSGICMQLPNEYGEWIVDDGSGEAVIDDRLSEPEVDIYNGFTYDVIGVIDCYIDFKVQATEIAYEEGQNMPPTVVIGDDFSVNYGDNVTLDGTSSYDADGSIVSYFWNQEEGISVFFGEPEAPAIGFVAPNEFSIIVFSLQVTDDLGATSVDYITITVGEVGEVEISDIINNCSFGAGETIDCDGQYDLSTSSALECPLYGQSLTTSGVIVDYFDITPWNGPHSFTIQDTDGNQIDFVVWPESSSYQDGFDITQTDLNVLTNPETFGTYGVEIMGELGAYCDDDEQLDIYSEWQITVEYESDITFMLYDSDDLGCTNPDAPNYNPDATIDDGSCLAVEVAVSDIINNCSFGEGETIDCDGQYDLSASSALECPLYGQSLTTSGVIVDYFDITPFNGPHSFTIQDTDGNQIDFVVWPESSFYQDGFDITATDLNVLTQEPFGVYEVQITGELGAYCDDDEQLDIYSEWQITVEYESDIIINYEEGQNMPPTVVIGDDFSVNYGDNVTLDGTSSYDADGSIVSYFWNQEEGISVFFGEPEAPAIGFVAPNEFSIIVFSLQVTDDLGATSVDYITITVGEVGEVEISDIINNCSFGAGETIDCDGQYDLSTSSALECPLYGQSLTTSGVIVDYFDITPFNGPHSFTIQDTDGNQIDFVIWPESSSYQDGFDITATDLNVLTQEPFGVYEVQITGELGAYCDDDEQLDIYSEWQITVEYESDITIDGDSGGEDCIAGDVNEDGVINVLDIIEVVNIIIYQNSELTDYEFCLFDLNSDGIINVIDIISLVNMIIEN